MNLHLKKASPTDLKIWRQISIQTFTQSFAIYHSQEEMDDYLNIFLSEEYLAKELAQDQSEVYLAYLDQNLVGYLKINWDQAQTEDQGQDALEVQRIYVLHAYGNQGIGQKLLNFSIQRAQDLGKSFIWLGVYVGNQAAIRFYTRNGFYKFCDHIFMFGKKAQRDDLYRLDLTK